LHERQCDAISSLTGLAPSFTEFRRTFPFVPDMVTLSNGSATKGKTMHRYIQHRERKHLFWGIALIAVGCLFLLDRQGIIRIDQAWRLWPAAFALFGLVRIVTARRGEHVVKGIFTIVFAAWLYVSIEQLWGWTFATTWPIILIALGVKAVAGGLISFYRQSRKESAQ
jgi:hypothetical protein